MGHKKLCTVSILKIDDLFSSQFLKFILCLFAWFFSLATFAFKWFNEIVSLEIAQIDHEEKRKFPKS